MTERRKSTPRERVEQWRRQVAFFDISDVHTRSQRLTDLQQAILQVIWGQGPSRAEQIRGALHTRHPLKDSSLRTMLRRLEARGYVGHRTERRAFVYSAKLTPKDLVARAVRPIIERFCAGSVQQFLGALIDEQVLPLKELHRLMRRGMKGGHNR